MIYAICARPYVTISSLFSRMVRVAKRSVHQQNLVAAELRRSVEALEALRSTAHDQSANLEVRLIVFLNENRFLRLFQKK